MKKPEPNPYQAPSQVETPQRRPSQLAVVGVILLTGINAIMVFLGTCFGTGFFVFSMTNGYKGRFLIFGLFAGVIITFVFTLKIYQFWTAIFQKPVSVNEGKSPEERK